MEPPSTNVELLLETDEVGEVEAVGQAVRSALDRKVSGLGNHGVVIRDCLSAFSETRRYQVPVSCWESDPVRPIVQFTSPVSSGVFSRTSPIGACYLVKGYAVGEPACLTLHFVVMEFCGPGEPPSRVDGGSESAVLPCLENLCSTSPSDYLVYFLRLWDEQVSVELITPDELKQELDVSSFVAFSPPEEWGELLSVPLGPSLVLA
jgi:hypothetical protein